MVFQHFMLADNFTVWENIVLGDEPGTRVLARSRPRPTPRLRELGEQYGLERRPRRAGRRSRRRRQAAGRDPQGPLPRRQASSSSTNRPPCSCPRRSTSSSARCASSPPQGTTVIFISHKLDEVLKHADAITVIRQGKTVGEIDDPTTVTSRDLAEMMVGSELPTPETRGGTVTDIAVLEARRPHRSMDAEQRERLLVDHVSFTIHRGEIVGIAGVEGNGQSELVRALIGLDPSTGTISLDGDDITKLSTQRAPRRGHRLHRRGPPERRARACRSRCGRTPRSATNDVAPYGRGPWIDRAGARSAGPQQIIDASTSARRARRPDLHAVGRQPAEVDRRARDARPTRRC